MLGAVMRMAIIAVLVSYGLMALVVVACALAGVRFASKPRYRDPQLHEGRWSEPASKGDGSVVWYRTSPHFLEPVKEDHHGECVPYECIIMPGLAHEDRCACGKRRHGVHGSWW